MSERIQPLSVVLVSPDRAFRARLREILADSDRIWIVGEASAGIEAIAVVRRTQPGVVILDLAPSLGEPLAFVRALLNIGPKARILAIEADRHAQYSEENALDALAAGALGYLGEGEMEQMLAKAVEKVDEGEAWVPRHLVGPLLAQFQALTDNVSVDRARIEGGSEIL